MQEDTEIQAGIKAGHETEMHIQEVTYKDKRGTKAGRNAGREASRKHVGRGARDEVSK
jgi:hypothetical protein